MSIPESQQAIDPPGKIHQVTEIQPVHQTIETDGRIVPLLKLPPRFHHGGQGSQRCHDAFALKVIEHCILAGIDSGPLRKQHGYRRIIGAINQR